MKISFSETIYAIGHRYDELIKKTSEMERENKGIQHQNELQTRTIAQISSEKEKYLRELSELKEETKLLTNDKSYLTKDNMFLQEKNKRLEDKVKLN